MTQADARPLFMTGNFAPVPDEIDAVDLPLTGALPPELRGRYFRNGPNPLPGSESPHWFTAPGMVHGVRIADGKASWYRNRWVRTAALEGRPFLTDHGPDYAAVVANTHVIHHDGKILALVENGFPYELTPELDTVGPVDFGGRLAGAMTAHPKRDPKTGDLHFFGYSAMPPFVTYHRLSAAGELVHSEPVPVGKSTMMHDFAITENHILWLDLPMTFQFSLLEHKMPFTWDDTYGARIGVMPRPDRATGDGTPAGQKVQWFDIDPCYVFHVGDAHEDSQGRIMLDGCRYSPADTMTMWEQIGGSTVAELCGHAAAAAATGVASLHRWTLDPATNTVSEERLADRALEFPTIDGDRTGLPARYRYVIADDNVTGGQHAIAKFDADSGSLESYELGPDVVAGEAVFVPTSANSRSEDDGWLLSITTTTDGKASELLVLDATDVSGSPVARIELPRGVPSGFHGSWIPDEQP